MANDTNLVAGNDAGGGVDVSTAGVDPGASTVDATAQPDASTATPPSPPESGESREESVVTKDFLDEFDMIGTDQEKTEPTQKNTPESESSSLSPNNPSSVASEQSDAATSQSKTGEPNESSDDGQKADASTETDDDPSETNTVEESEFANWNKLSQEEEAYIQKHLPKVEWKNARKAHKDAKLSRAFMNPSCPPEQFVSNLERKSGMRFNQVEGEILKRNAEKDPVGLLSKIYEATQDTEGNSETYQRLLDSTITTNTEYVLEVLKRQGYELAKGNGDATANQASNDLTKLADGEIDEFLASDEYQQMQEVYPEKAEKLKGLLDAAKAARAKAAELDAAKEKEKQSQQTEKQRREQEAAETARKQYVSDFSTVYEGQVTSYVNNILNKDYGLAVTPEEKEKNPMMAFLKNAKTRLITFGGLDGSGDFDNDLYQWGQNRPAFKQAAKSMVDFTRAGEKDNAANAAKELIPFIDLFLADRLKLPELALMDELIQIVARDQKAKLDTKEDRVSDGSLSRTTSAAGGSFLDEIDNMQV